MLCTLDLGHEEPRLPNIVLSADRSPYAATSAAFEAMQVTGGAELDSLRTSKFD